MKGEFRIWLPESHKKTPSGIIIANKPDIVITNRVTNEGETDFLKGIFRDDLAIAGGGNFYVGLCNQVPAETDTLSDISTEPTSAGGYARQAITRDGSGWPTITTINGHTVIRSDTMSFTASGADFDAAITRPFLTDASSGSSGILYALGGAISAERTVLDTETLSVQYQFALD